MTTLDITEYQEQLQHIFTDHGVVLAYLFGSQAEGKAGPISDVDIAVLLGPQVDREQWFQVQLDLIGELTGLFHRNDVDVVILNEATPLLAYQVVRYGRILYEDEAMLPAVDFAAHAVSRYADTVPLRRLKRRYLEEWLEARHYARAAEPTAPYHWQGEERERWQGEEREREE
jgi:predicted nucleotidyltransferase